MNPVTRQPRPATPDLPELPWHARLNALNMTLLVFALLVIASLPVMEGSDRSIAWTDGLGRFLAGFFPPDPSVLPQVGAGLWETIEIAVMATLFAVIASLGLGVAAAQNLAPVWLVVSTRMLLNGVRTLPSLIWALLAVVVYGANPLAGVVGLTCYSVGYLGKFFSEAFESVDVEVARGLRGLGASRLQAFQYGLWPHARPLIWSHALWMLEYNIRSASIIGYVGAGGLGTLIHAYMEYGWYDRLCTVLIGILLVVTLLDFFGEWLRKRILTGSPARRRLGRPEAAAGD